MKLVSKLIYSGILLIATVPVLADVNINGFATMAGGMTSDSDESLYGYDDTISYEQDSLFGLQANAILDDGLEAVVQIKATGEGDWEPKFEWAYISYKANDNMKFILGRQRVPFYMYSDYVDVGYAYHWIRPPQGVYSLPFDSAEGLGFLLTNSFSSWDSTFHVLIAREQSMLDIAGNEENMDLQNLMSFSWTLTRDWLTLHASHTLATMDLSIQDADALAAGWSAATEGVRTLAELTSDDTYNDIADNMAPIANNLTFEEDDVSFTGVGVIVDYEPFLLAAEWTKLDLEDGIYGTNESSYISAGFRVQENFLIHMTYGKDKDEAPDIDLTGIPMNVSDGLSTEIDNAVNGLLALTPMALASSEGKSSYNTVGVRWDFHPSAAVKLEFTDFTDDDNSNNDAKLIRFAISTVF